MPNVCVEVRIRPNSRNILEFSGNKVVVGSKIFTFAKVHNRTTQISLFNSSILPFIEKFLNGGNCSILAYGQTGSGKTYTMGLSHKYEQGIIQNSLEILYKRGMALTCSFIEIYNEEIYDLMNDTRQPLNIRAGADEINIVGLKEIPANTFEEAISILQKGSENRTTKSTKMNSESSRSHAIFTISMCQKINEQIVESKLTFVDLAGSERLKRSECKGNAAKEAISINCGLLSLGNVISALYLKKAHVPFRDSKLTRILQKCLNGNALLIACISGLQEDAFETANTLKYASRAALISLNEKVHVENDKDKLVILNLKKEISRLKEENNRLRLQAIYEGLKRENIRSHPLVIELINRLKIYEGEEFIKKIVENLNKGMADLPLENSILINESKNIDSSSKSINSLDNRKMHLIGSSNMPFNSLNLIKDKTQRISFKKNVNSIGDIVVNDILDKECENNNGFLQKTNSTVNEPWNHKASQAFEDSDPIVFQNPLKVINHITDIKSIDDLKTKDIKHEDNTPDKFKTNHCMPHITNASESFKNTINSENITDLAPFNKESNNQLLVEQPSHSTTMFNGILNINNPSVQVNIPKQQINKCSDELNDQSIEPHKPNCLLPNLFLFEKIKLNSQKARLDSKIENTGESNSTKTLKNCLEVPSLDLKESVALEEKGPSRKRTRLVSFDLEPKVKSQLFTPLKEVLGAKLHLIDEFEDYNAISMLKHDNKLFFNCIDSKIRFYDGKVGIAASDDSIRCMFSYNELFYSSRSLLKVLNSQGRTLPVFAYKAEISTLKVSDNFIFTGHDDGSLNILDRHTNQIIFNEKIHKSTIFDICLFNDSIYTCSRDHSVKFSEIKTGFNELSFVSLSPPHYDTVSCLLLFKNKCISLGRDSSIKAWNKAVPFKTVPYAHDAWIKSAISLENLFVTGCKNGILKCWNFIDNSIRCVGKIDVSFSINSMTEYDGDIWISCQNKKIQRYSIS